MHPGYGHHGGSLGSYPPRGGPEATFRSFGDRGGGGGGPMRFEDRGSRAFKSGGDKRGDRDKPVWQPGHGRNPDLEAEKMTGAGLARPYSEHDDRRDGGNDGEKARTRRGASPTGEWRHDLHNK